MEILYNKSRWSNTTIPLGSNYMVLKGLSDNILRNYNTVIGVGDSIVQGEYDLGSGIYDDPFRGVTFKTAAQYGTTLSNIKDTISNFTSLASGNTLFIVRAGINDCNALLSPNGVGDGALGGVLSWDDLPENQKQEATTLLQDIVALLKPFGDVAIATITYCDAKGQLSVMPDKGRNLHTGSWNDNLNVPLCKTLTPKFWDSVNQRPVFDYYTVVYDNPDILDVDNLHFYSDFYYFQNEAGYPNPGGSYTLRTYTHKRLSECSGFRATPYDDKLFKDRVLINVGKGVTLAGRPSFQRDCNELSVESTSATFNDVLSYKGLINLSTTVTFPSNPTARGNNNTTSQPWDEGIGDRNIASSAIASNNIITPPQLVLNGLTGLKGKVRVMGIFVSEGAGSVYDPTMKSVYTIIDDNAARDIEKPNSINGVDVNIQDCIAEFDFDCSLTDTLTVLFKKAEGSTYGTLSGIEILVNK